MPPIKFSTIILKFGKKGEKTGWRYIEIPEHLAKQLYSSTKTFRVKGKLDKYQIKGIAVMPMGEGNFILPINGSIRKVIKKREGNMINVELEHDSKRPEINEDLMHFLCEEREAFRFFNLLPKSHQLYFSKWIGEAKTEETKAKRIAQTLIGLNRKQRFGEMLRWNKEHKDDMP